MAQVVLNHDELAKKIDELKKQGKKVIFANGCFDLLHVGHVRYLRGAKALGDVLVLAINSDASVRRLKGPERPLLPLEDRLGVLAAFEMIDYITSFEEDTVSPLLLKLKPNVQVKGTDYTPDSIPEKDTVASFGGTVAVVGDPKDHASKNLIQEILRKYGPQATA
ncbi:MAG TPA: adenylyltransferase/cytidyltransferase family protein [bacterium]|jgi:rfaE bifunctional protein nucleotidyltransferase chain/domain|nr:adenylyltransferase/cytidyltransferase family protein [bacterium]